MSDAPNASNGPGWQGSPPTPPPPPVGQGWPQQMPPGGWQPHPQVIVKKGPGCFTIGFIVLAVLAVLGIGAVVLVALVANEAVKELEEATGEADPGDYTLSLDVCANDNVLGPQASGLLTNTSDEKQGFRIEVRFTDQAGVLISEDSTFMDALEIGQAGTWEVTSLDNAVGEVNCEVSSVDYHIFDSQD